MALNITTTAFEYGAKIPALHSCKGEDMAPPLQWDGEPKETVSFALILEDTDASEGTFTHWIVYNLPAGCHNLDKTAGVRKNLENGAFQGKNDFGKTGYRGPCPPKGEEHHYFFRLYALKKKLPPESIKNGTELHRAINGLVLDQAEYMGTA
jgi:Raf kinase inhibitor-like YbhB/YbcL family protein